MTFAIFISQFPPLCSSDSSFFGPPLSSCHLPGSLLALLLSGAGSLILLQVLDPLKTVPRKWPPRVRRSIKFIAGRSTGLGDQRLGQNQEPALSSPPTAFSKFLPVSGFLSRVPRPSGSNLRGYNYHSIPLSPTPPTCLWGCSFPQSAILSFRLSLRL